MLSDYSDIVEVQRKARKYLGKEVQPSTRKGKKFMVYDGTKWVHFGQLGYTDFSLNKDEEKRRRFRLRNHKWANAPKFSPAWLSYHLLW